jgi:signal transduction histidine kinase
MEYLSKEARYQQILQVFVDLEHKLTTFEQLPEYLNFAHQLLKTILYAENFYIALYQPSENTIQYIYNVDTVVEPVDPSLKVQLVADDESPSAWVIHHQRKLLFSPDETGDFIGHEKHWGIGPKAEHWLGIPLISLTGECIGVAVIQSYDPAIKYTQEDQNIFSLFSSIISVALTKNELLRTDNYYSPVDTNALKHELQQKRSAEKLQRVLFNIASIATQELPLRDFFEKIHQNINELIYAQNFYIALYDENSHRITFPYFVDVKDGRFYENLSLPVGDGLTSYIIQTQKAHRLTPQAVKQLLAEGKMKEVYGDTNFVMWLGAPLLSANKLHGIIVVQSYDPKILYSQADLDILTFVANQISTVIESAIQQQQRIEAQTKLEDQHELLALQNSQLTQALQKLKATQKELVQQEKMASLGSLVAGIAHEINTPLGICVTCVSHLQEEAEQFIQHYQNNTISRKMMEKFCTHLSESLTILSNNTHRAAALIQSFKQVAVDQSNNNFREIELSQYLHEVVLSLQPQLKSTQHKITINCDPNLVIYSNAGAISQIVTNLLINSLVHGFEHKVDGKIELTITADDSTVMLVFQDDGCGMNPDQLRQLFDPFFTTKRGKGGSGLGTHIVYNLVTQALKGKIQVSSGEGKGMQYVIQFPRTLVNDIN